MPCLSENLNMSDKFQNKYRITSSRLQSWDYTQIGAYFITICTKNRQNYFGNIIKNKMNYSLIGELAIKFWYDIENRYQNVELNKFVIMPNHIHGILILKDINLNNYETGHALSLQIRENLIGKYRFQNIGKNSISSIVGSFKSAVTKNANLLGIEFQWQKRFYDHIIRDEKAFEKIRNYIMNNLTNWKNDQFYNF